MRIVRSHRLNHVENKKQLFRTLVIKPNARRKKKSEEGARVYGFKASKCVFRAGNPVVITAGFVRVARARCNPELSWRNKVIYT